MSSHRLFVRRAKALTLVSGVALVVGCAAPADSGPTTTTQELAKLTFNSDGTLNRPSVEYRKWVYVGTPLTPNSLNPPEAPFPEFHNVYIHPADFAHYEETGEFPDGTVMVKELALVGSEQAVSGKGFFQGEFVGLEATIKDSQRYPNEPGNWAYFSFGHTYPLAETAEAFPTGACNTCHEVSAAEDFVFTQYYPVLRAAKARATQGGGGAMDSESAAFQEMTTTMSGALAAGMEPTVTRAAAPGAVPTDDTALHAYLGNSTYTDMPHSEAGTHPSVGPHSDFGLPVRVFMNEPLDASLRAGNASHPVGSEAVKEMYTADGTLEGWAVMVKTQDDSDGGAGWFWYEITSTTDDSSPVASGNGVPLCFGCHSTGADFVLSNYPLR